MFSRCHDGCHVSTLPGRTVDLLAPRRALLPVVIPAGQDHKKLAIQLVNQAMFLIDAARPAAGQVFPQGLGFANASEGIAQAGLDQLVAASLVQPMSGPVHHIVGADVDWNELLVFNQQLKRDAIAKVDGDKM